MPAANILYVWYEISGLVKVLGYFRIALGKCPRNMNRNLDGGHFSILLFAQMNTSRVEKKKKNDCLGNILLFMYGKQTSSFQNFICMIEALKKKKTLYS